jgi:hypothetical protein
VDGIEMTFALNHLAYFLLTKLLLEPLKASAPARIINVSSDAQSFGKIDFDNLQGERTYSGFGPYGNSKLKNNPDFLIKIMGAVIPLIARSPEKGAKTSIYLASSPKIKWVTGRYFVDCKTTQPAHQATDRAVARTLWNVSAKMVHLADAVPGIV